MGTTPKLDAVRSGPGYYTTEEELLQALQQAAGLEEDPKKNDRDAGDLPAASADEPEFNDQQQAMVKVLKRFIKGLVQAGALEGDGNAVGSWGT